MVGNTSGEANMFGSGSMPVKEWERLQECLFGNKAQAYMELAQVKEPEDIPPRDKRYAHRDGGKPCLV